MADDPQSPTGRSAGNETPDFASVYDAEFAYVYNTLRRLGAREHDLEDLAQDVFVVVHRRLADFDPNRPIRPWLFGIAYRVFHDFLRKARHRREITSDEMEATQNGKPRAEEQVIAAERRQLVIEALATLEENRRAVLIMHDIDGHSMPEIQEVLSVPLNTLYSRLRLARRDFAAAVKRLRARQRGSHD